MTTPPAEGSGPSKSTIEDRITRLRREYDSGLEQMRALEQRRGDLQNTLQRITGAIQVLEEMLTEHQ
ncbi:MAG: hypothetical protein FD176_877 [Rhodospirillaceae bacterium]|nr:MAG: hypothetical protein FD176_877 [Rhodospirillaceae bacterium]TNC97858.1 MAG: hypothetical protein FD119_846 [Stygiobacter sp.]